MAAKKSKLLLVLVFLSFFMVSCSTRKQSPQSSKGENEAQSAKGYIVYINEDTPGKNVMYNAPIGSKEKKKKIYDKNPYSAVGYESKIAFLSDETGKRSLYMVNADGSELKTVVSGVNIVPNTLSWSHDGKKILFAAKMPGDDFEQIYYVEADEGKTPVNITSSEGSKKSPAFSGDGKFLIYALKKENNYDIVKHDMASQSETILFSSPGNDISPQVTPDGTRLLFLSDEKQSGMHDLYMADMDGGNKTQLTKDLNIAENSVRVSPDSSMVSFVTFDNMGKQSVQIMNMNKSTVMISNDSYISSWSSNGKKLYYGAFDPKNRRVVEFDVLDKTMKDILKVEYKPGEESTGIRFLHFTEKLKES